MCVYFELFHYIQTYRSSPHCWGNEVVSIPLSRLGSAYSFVWFYWFVGHDAMVYTMLFSGCLLLISILLFYHFFFLFFPSFPSTYWHRWISKHYLWLAPAIDQSRGNKHLRFVSLLVEKNHAQSLAVGREGGRGEGGALGHANNLVELRRWRPVAQWSALSWSTITTSSLSVLRWKTFDNWT